MKKLQYDYTVKQLYRMYLAAKYPLDKYDRFSQVYLDVRDAWEELITLSGSKIVWNTYSSSGDNVRVDVNVDIDTYDKTLNELKKAVGLDSKCKIDTMGSYWWSSYLRECVFEHFHITERVSGNGGGWWTTTITINQLHNDYRYIYEINELCRKEELTKDWLGNHATDYCIPLVQAKTDRDKALTDLRINKLKKKIEDINNLIKEYQTEKAALNDRVTVLNEEINDHYKKLLDKERKEYKARHQRRYTIVSQYFKTKKENIDKNFGRGPK